MSFETKKLSNQSNGKKARGAKSQLADSAAYELYRLFHIQRTRSLWLAVGVTACDRQSQAPNKHAVE